MTRGNQHDLSKYESEEFPFYAEMMDEFEKHPFGTVGHAKAKAAIKSAVEHHYKHNRHHPEYFENGINGMNLIDLIELLADWKSATQNHPEMPGDILKSLKIGVEKYGISSQLNEILLNTLRDFDMIDNHKLLK